MMMEEQQQQPSPGAKLDTMSREDLLKLVKKYAALHKQLKAKSDELSAKLAETTDENEQQQRLKSLVDDLQQQNARLAGDLEAERRHVVELTAFRDDELEKARREIELNKTMLDMLNNEIKMLSDEKSTLEKRIFNGQPPATPSATPSTSFKKKKKKNRHHHHLMPVMAAPSHPAIIEEDEDDLRAEADEDDDEQVVVNENKEAHDHDVEFMRVASANEDGILVLNKHIEELTFYVDELKSELEAEREKSQELEKRVVATAAATTTDDVATANSSSSSSLDNVLEFLLVADANDEKRLEQLSLGGDNKQRVLDLLARAKTAQERTQSFEQQMERIIKDFRQEIDSLEAQLRESKAELGKNKTQLSQLEAKNKTLQSDLDSEREKLKTTQSQLEKYEKEASKSKMLDLEIADYERTIKSLNVQLIAKERDIGELKSEQADSQDKYNKLKAEFDTLEKDKATVDERCAKLKQLLIKAKKDVTDAKNQEVEHLSNDAALKGQLEAYASEIENYKLQMSATSADMQRVQDKMQSMQEANARLSDLYESKLDAANEQIRELQSHLAQLKSEHEAYKVKVQHAFKKKKQQQQEEQPAAENRSKEELHAHKQELEQLKSTCEKLTERLETAQEKAKLAEKENEHLQEEYGRVLERNTKLLNELRQKELEWKTKNDELQKDNASRNEDTIELIRTLKAQNESQAEAFKEKMKQLTAQNCQAIDMLQMQLTQTTEENARLQREFADLKESRSSHEVSTLANTDSRNTSTASLNSQQQQSNVAMFIKPPLITTTNLDDDSKISGKFTPMTLEQLLASTTPTSTSNNLLSPLSPTSPVPHSFAASGNEQQLKVDLQKTKLQLEHLNELLNESEHNNSRLADQVNLLKDEIRRLERNQEREKSISNMEYLKNVVYKFLTFQTSQERAQLLPVLSTMLKLSQEEQNTLMNIKVIGPNTTTTASTAKDSSLVNAGWSSYLPKWN